MISATDEDVRPRPEIQSCWHAIINRVTVDDGRHIFRDTADHYRMQRIDYIHAAYRNIGSRVSVSYEKRIQWRVIDHSAETSWGDSSHATGWCTRASRAEGTARDAANARRELWPVMARDIRVESTRSRMA